MLSPHQALLLAIQEDREEEARALAPDVDLLAHDFQALRLAAEKGRAWFIPWVRKEDRYRLPYHVAERGTLETQLLLIAANHGQRDWVSALVRHSHVRPAIALRGALVQAVMAGNEPAMDTLLSAKASFKCSTRDPGISPAAMLLHTVIGNHGAMLDRLVAMPEVDFIHHSDHVLEAAITYDHPHLVSKLLPWANDLAKQKALCHVARHGDPHDFLTKILKSMSDVSRTPAIQDALMQAAEGGNVKALDQLLPSADPNANQGEALRVALRWGHDACVRCLVPVTEMEPVRVFMAKQGQWESLDRLCAFLPDSVTSEWVQRHRHLELTRARLRQEESLQTPPESSRRRRLRS